MQNIDFAQTTKNYSSTFYRATLFFPKGQREDVFALYTFLRFFDDLVDINHNKKAFYDNKNRLIIALDKDRKTDDVLLDTFIDLYNKYSFRKEWLIKFWQSLETDLKPNLQFKNYPELEDYIYGVADVVGLMMARIIKAPPEAYLPAQTLGKAMQLVNIIRDLKEDYQLNRVYLPQDDLRRFDISSITQYQGLYKENFIKFIRFEIERSWKLFTTAKNSLYLIPSLYRKPIRISLAMYYELSLKIHHNPLLVWRGKTKVPKIQALWIIVRNAYV